MKQILDIQTPAGVERLAASSDGRVAVQDETSISFLDVAGGCLNPVISERLGHEIVAVVAAGHVVLFQEDDGLTVHSEDGRRRGQADLSEDAEIVAGRSLLDGRGAIILKAEMVGEPLESGIPQFRFILARPDLTILSIKSSWPQCPLVWAVDERSQRLLVQGEPGGGVLTEFDLQTGQAAGQARWETTRNDPRVLTSCDLSATDGRAIVGLAEEETQVAQLVLVEQRDAKAVVLAEFRQGGACRTHPMVTRRNTRALSIRIRRGVGLDGG